MIRIVSICAITFVALPTFVQVGVAAERRASQKVKNAVYPLRGMNAEDAVKILTASLPRSARNIMLIPHVESGRVIMQAPAYRIRQFQRALKLIEGPPLFSF